MKRSSQPNGHAKSAPSPTPHPTSTAPTACKTYTTTTTSTVTYSCQKTNPTHKCMNPLKSRERIVHTAGLRRTLVTRTRVARMMRLSICPANSPVFSGLICCLDNEIFITKLHTYFFSIGNSKEILNWFFEFSIFPILLTPVFHAFTNSTLFYQYLFFYLYTAPVFILLFVFYFLGSLFTLVNSHSFTLFISSSM